MQHVFPQTRSFDPLWLSSWRESDLLLESSLGNGNSNRRTTQQHGKTNNHSKTDKKTCTTIHPGCRAKSLFWLKLKSHSNPSRIQSTFTKHKLNSENSHECGMTKTIGLSKTQSKQIQLHSQASPPFPDSSKDAGNPLQWQVNLESATSQLFSNHCGLLCELGSYTDCKLQKENYVTST